MINRKLSSNDFMTMLKYLLSLLITLLHASLLNKSINLFKKILHTPIYSIHIKQSLIINYIINTCFTFLFFGMLLILIL